MKLLDRLSTVAEIVKTGSEVYGLLVDKARTTAEYKAEIARLQRELADAKAAAK